MLSGDVERYKAMIKNIDKLTFEDFIPQDQNNLLRKATAYLPKTESTKIDPETGEKTTFLKPDLSQLPGRMKFHSCDFASNTKHLANRQEV